MKPGDQLTDKLTNAIAEGFRRATVADHEDAKERAHDKGVHLAELWEQESAEVLREHFARWMDDEHTSPELREQLQKLTEPTHFVQLAAVIPALLALGYVLGSAALEGPASQLRTLSLRNLGDVPWPADLMIGAVARNRASEGAAVKMAQDAGLDDSYVDELIKAAQQPPPLGTLIELARRGKIGVGQIAQAMRQSGSPDEWADLMGTLLYAPVPWSEALRAELQGVIDAGTATRLLALDGIDPANHDWLYEANGMPPPIEELIQLWRRGIATEGDVHQALLEGPLKNKWIPLVMQMRDRIPPQETVIALTRRGVFTKPEGIDLLHKGGFPLPLATKMIEYADNIGDDDVRAVTKAEVLAAYDVQMLSRDQARAALLTTRYSPEHADMVLNLADMQRERRIVNAALTRLRTMYVGHKIDNDQLQQLFDQLQVTAGMREDLTHVWTIERSTATRQLTAAQIAQAVKRRLLTETEGLERLRGDGYDDDDANVLLSLATGRRTVALIVKAVKQEQLSPAAALDELGRLGYTQADAQFILDVQTHTDTTGEEP